MFYLENRENKEVNLFIKQKKIYNYDYNLRKSG